MFGCCLRERESVKVACSMTKLVGVCRLEWGSFQTGRSDFYAQCQAQQLFDARQFGIAYV